MKTKTDRKRAQQRNKIALANCLSSVIRAPECTSFRSRQFVLGVAVSRADSILQASGCRSSSCPPFSGFARLAAHTVVPDFFIFILKLLWPISRREHRCEASCTALKTRREKKSSPLFGEVQGCVASCDRLKSRRDRLCFKLRLFFFWEGGGVEGETLFFFCNRRIRRSARVLGIDVL